MEETSTNPSLVNHAVKWGLISAAISIIVTLLLYAIDYTLMVQIKFALFSLVIYLGLVVYAGIEYRKLEGGYLDFGKAYLHGLIILALSGLVATIFQILLYTVIDPELPAKLVDASIENTRAMMENFGAPADSIDEAIEKAKTDTEARFTMFGLAKGYIWVVVVSAVLALITGLIVKKRQPVEF
jgi:hypothetical protein